MKTIKVSDEMYDFLMDLSKKLNTQNNRGTANPRFYQVMHKKKVYVPEGTGWDYEWIDDSYEIVMNSYDDKINYLIDYCNHTEEELKYKSSDEINELLIENNCKCVEYNYESIFENAFLTEEACKKHIKFNNHHYNGAVDYLSYAFRNPELEQLIIFLMELSKEK